MMNQILCSNQSSCLPHHPALNPTTYNFHSIMDNIKALWLQYVKLIEESMKHPKRPSSGPWWRTQGGQDVRQLQELKSIKQDSERRTGKFRPGRPKKLTEAQLDRIEKWFDSYYEHRIISLQDIIQKFALECSPSALLGTLHKRGFHTHTPGLKKWLSPKNKE